jgi:hypothetical protein
MNEKRKENLLGGVITFAVAGAMTAWQILRWNHERAWIIFRLWFIPVPFILITGIAVVVGLFYFIRGVFNID